MLKNCYKSLLILIIFCLSCNVHAQQLSKEYQIKAAIIFQLSKFIMWEAPYFINDPTSPINLCLLQPEPFGNYIDALAKESNLKTQQHPVKILRVNKIDDLSICHILFLSQKETVPELDLPDKPVLISNEYSLVNSSNHINIYTEKDRIKFEVNIDNINQDNIKLKSQLLSVAKIVKNTSGKP